MPPAKKDLSVVWEATQKLLEALNPDNPRDHFEDDIEATAMSLLEAGWAEIGISRQQGGYLIGGHGRVQAAHWLSQQSFEWFEHQWEKWVSASDQRAAIADHHRDRFTPAYWVQCPVKINNLDEKTQQATMIRLNNQAKDGQDNHQKMAALLSKLDKKSQEQAGWNAKEAEIFMSQYIVRKQEREAAIASETDFEAKQYFERADATDYSGDPSEPNDAIALSSPVFSSNSGLDLSALTAGLSWDDVAGEVSNDGLVSFDTDAIGDFKQAGVNYDTNIAETRAVLLMSQKQLDEYKELALGAAKRMRVDLSPGVKAWRPQTVIMALRFVCDNIEAPPEPQEAESDEEE